MNRKMALVIGEAFYPEDFIINDLVKTWKKRGYEIEVLTRTPSYPFGKVFEGYKNKIYQKTSFEGIKVHRFPVITGYQKSGLVKLLNYISFIIFGTITALFIGRKFDRVFIYQTGPLTVALPGVFLKIVYGTKLGIWTQDLWPDTVYAYGYKKTFFLQMILNRIVKFVYKNCDKIFISCYGFEKPLKVMLPKKDIHWVPNWPMVVNDKPKVRLKLPGSFNFTFTGNVGKVQNLEIVVKAFKEVSDSEPNVFLNIVGDGSNLEALKQIVEENGIQNVNFTGRRPIDEMPSFFEASDVLFLSLVKSPLYSIMIPSKFPTYLTASKPVFAIMDGEVPDMIKDYKIGVTAPPDSIEKIVEGFRYFLSLSETERFSLSQNSNLLLENKFSKERAVNTFESQFWTGD
ncbi:glycosyltransferase family 4 protein [Cyclobacterium jeungdonense]|uniref:Glycosyltransferase family 4 protein n=1 Tax=Cyclobacterium jeungdonense TaxID=708087 RepID=A0ABT8C1B9_9BACT|nr:glycosyltransferase family 4 protein [Cyclobacterium jeungdonense]MDN3686516.1 glycosyltransferase family 4 protein [Cyclobacterium jeungdonense]